MEKIDDSTNMIEQQKRVVYALNMCTVSVSQIIDYNDINILDQEYDAILNNLNLEEMPKDAPLLKILKDLLDVISHFRIQELEKEFIEKEYQKKMKNAIWSAVPNFGVILAGGNPLTMAVSLANQVGIGYMNYRRNKEEYNFDKEKQMWQIKKQALEQFDFIRRELFECAWQLSDQHKFPDSYRLTEKQIKQYNNILQDQNVLRKYERLVSVKDAFEAYPPFWYFIGNAANLIANEKSLELTEETRKDFRKKALEYFEIFENIEQNSILREDVLSASCALEHIDLLLEKKEYDVEEVDTLLKKAVKMAGNAFDILQLCAITYLKIQNIEEAIKIFKRLINEDYNSIINAQMLSAIYAHSIEKYRSDYEVLATRVNSNYLFPIPQKNQDMLFLEKEFEEKNKCNLKYELEEVMDALWKKYCVRWNSILSNFEKDNNYKDSFFYDNDDALKNRKNEAGRIFGNNTLKEKYQKSLLDCNYESSMMELLNEYIDKIFTLKIFADNKIQSEVEDSIKNMLASKREKIESIQKAINGQMFQLYDYNLSQTISLSSIAGGAMKKLLVYGKNLIEKSTPAENSNIENEFFNFCIKEKIEIPVMRNSRLDEKLTSKDSSIRFESDLFGHQAIIDRKNNEYIDNMVHYIKKHVDNIVKNNDKTIILMRDDQRFNGYFKNQVFSENPNIERHATMVVMDTLNKSDDLIFTTDGIVNIHKRKIGFLTPYNEVKVEKDKLLLFRKKYDNNDVDIYVLADLISNISNRFLRNIEEYVEYIPGEINMKIILSWFEKNKMAMKDNVVRVIASPTKDNLVHFGFIVDEDLDTGKNIMQCFYDSKTDDVLGKRFLRGEGIDSRIVSLILENDGIVYIGRREK